MLTYLPTYLPTRCAYIQALLFSFFFFSLKQKIKKQKHVSLLVFRLLNQNEKLDSKPVLGPYSEWFLTHLPVT